MKSMFLLLCMCLSAWAVAVPDAVVPNLLPPGDVTSATFTVTVNGIVVPVANSRDVSYARFAFTGTARVVITANRTLVGARLSPAAANLAPVVAGSAMSFSLDRPRKLIVHKVPGTSEKLVILADAMEAGAPVSGGPGVTTLSGVDATGGTDVSAGIQSAINNLASGGTLYVPPGIYAFTDLRMRSNANVYLAPGAMLRANTTGAINAQINFTGVNNASLRGRGVIDGDGYRLRSLVSGREEGRTLLASDQGVTTSNVLIEGVTIRNPPIWAFIVFDTIDWKMRNLAILSDSDYANRDGIDPHNAQRLVIDDCLFVTSDDCIAYSTTRNNINLATTIKNSVMYNSNSGANVRIGPYVGDGTTNLTVENIDVVQGCEKSANESALAIFAGGNLSDIRFRNIRAEDPKWRLFKIITNWSGDPYSGAQSGSASAILLDRISCAAQGYIELDAPFAENAIDGVSFRGFTYQNKAVASSSDCDYVSTGAVRQVSFGASVTPVVSLTMSALATDRTAPAELMVSVSPASAAALTIPLAVRGTARSGIDYTALPASVVLPAGQGAVRIALTPLANAIPGGRGSLVVEALHTDNRSYVLGSNYCAQTTVVSVAVPVNRAPVATNSSLHTGFNTPLVIPLTASDADGNTLTYVIVSGPGHGTLSGGGASRTYTPTAGYSGSDSITFRVNDGVVNSNLATVSVMVAAPVVVAAPDRGFSATYFNSFDLSGSGLRRTDAVIDFDFGFASPMPGINPDFSVRWQGIITPNFSQTYSFIATTDDGVRLWVDGKLLINQWVAQGATAATSSIALTAGRPVALVMEYYDGGGQGSAKLEWQSANQARQVVPLNAVAPTGLIPAGWTAGDVGAPGAVGSSTVTNGRWVVIGSGSDIWNGADDFHFLSRPVSGDLQITARVVSLTNTDPWAKAGVMLRANRTVGSQHTFMCQTAQNGLAYQRRPTANSGSVHTAGPVGNWVRLERIGTTCIAFSSTDGVVWTEVRREQVSLPNAVLVGLGVTSHAPGILNTVVFSDVVINAGGSAVN